MKREYLENIKSENRIDRIRLIMPTDPVIGGQPSDNEDEFTSNTPLLDLACTMKFAVDEIEKNKEGVATDLTGIKEALDTKASKEYVDEKFDNIKIPEYEKTKILQELGDQTDATISQKAITDEFEKVREEMATEIKIDLTGYATEKYVDDKIKNLQEVDLSEYATKEDLQESLKDIDLSDYATKTELQEQIKESTSSYSTIFSTRLIKEDLFSPCFIKTSPGTVAIKAGTSVILKSGKVATYSEDTKVELIGEHVMGSDYAIYADKNGLHAIVDNFEDPAEIPDDAVLIGGYHYSLVPENETLSTGQFATSGAGMIWTQADVDRIRGINEFSLWDIRFRAGGIIASPLSPRFGQLSNHSMAFDRATNRWYAMFHVSSDVDKFGVSRAGTDIASDTVKPIIPSAFNGNGVKKYGNLNWWTANELVQSQGARLLFEHEFNSRAFGTTENKVAGGSSSTYPKTERIKGLTSKIGCEQVTGVQWYWGAESGGSYTSSSKNSEGRGQPYYEPNKAIFGGSRTATASYVGSRYVHWHLDPWGSAWDIGAVATRDLLIL